MNYSNALSEVALYLARSDAAWVRKRLLAVAATAPQHKHRSVAIGALEDMAAHGYFRRIRLAELERLLTDETLAVWERSRVVSAIGMASPSRVSSDTEQFLVHWARSGDDEVGNESITALARLGMVTEYPDIMESRLGMVRRDGAWHFSPDIALDEHSTFAIGFLYEQRAVQFGAAFAAAIREAPPRALMQGIATLERLHHRRPSRTSPILCDALIARLHGPHTLLLPVAGLMRLAARLDAARFVNEDWKALLPGWDAELRAAQADAMGSAQYNSTSARARAAELLTELTRDSDYQVRRAAYRGLSRVEYTAYTDLCRRWPAGTEEGLRRRAAEACVWWNLEDLADEGSRLLGVLIGDEEPLVREAARRAAEEQRERRWADSYLATLTSGHNETNRRILDVWAYASALSAAGNDDSIARLADFAKGTVLAPHARHWIHRVLGELDRQWSEAKKDWPEPWSRWDGRSDSDGAVDYSDQ